MQKNPPENPPLLEVDQIVTVDEAVDLLMALHDKAAVAARVQGDPFPYVTARTKLQHTIRSVLGAAPVSKREFLNTYLKMWKSEGVPAPLNELQSIAAWLRESADPEAMKEKMRKRMLLLEAQAVHLNTQGSDAEARVGIYENRPDLKP